MFHDDDGRELIDQRWASAERRARLPMEESEYFDESSLRAKAFKEERSFHRFHLRRRLLLRHGDRLYGGFGKDMARGGLGFYSPVQLFPLAETLVVLGLTKHAQCRVVRCRRRGEECYEIGADILSSQGMEQELRNAVIAVAT